MHRALFTNLNYVLAGLVLAVTLGFDRPASAGTILNVDFNSVSSPTETSPPGFSAFNCPFPTTPGPVTNLFGTSVGLVSVTISGSSGNLSSRDRGGPPDSGAFTFGDMYRDFAVADNNGDTMTIALSGLTPNDTYQVRFYAFDGAVNSSGLSTATFTNISSGASGSVVYGFGAPPIKDDDYSVVLSAMASGAGTIVFTEHTVGNQTVPVLNGISIFQVPEPASAALGLLGALLGSFSVGRRRGLHFDTRQHVGVTRRMHLPRSTESSIRQRVIDFRSYVNRPSLRLCITQ